MQIKVACPDRFINVGVIDAALEATTRANESMAQRGLLPDLGTALRQGLKWRPEPWLGERFDLATECARRGWGDCDDLGPWLAAQLRSKGLGARAFARKSGRNRYHVQVETEDGRVLDPSVWAGMPSKRDGKELAVPQKSIAGPGESAICAVPWRGLWHARADFPLTERLHAAGWSQDRDPRAAIERALASYAALAEGVAGIGDAVVGITLGDIIAAAAPIAGGALGGPAGAALGAAAGQYAGQAVDSATSSSGAGQSGDIASLEAQIAALDAKIAQLAGIPGMADAMGQVRAQLQAQLDAAKAAAAKPKPAPKPMPISMTPALMKLGDATPIGGGPPGWPQGAATFAIPGPGGMSDGKVTMCPAGGPIIVRF